MKNKLIHITVETQNLPAPFAYECDIKIEPLTDRLDVNFTIKYLFREELPVEDLYEEGFTEEDDFEWKGDLGSNWSQEIEAVLEKTTYRKKPAKGNLSVEFNIFDGDGLVVSGQPSELEMWDYFLQELTQAVYEAGEKEMPFEVRLKSIKGNSEKGVHMRASFQERSALLQDGKVKIQLSWEELQNHMKTVFQPDYLIEKASEKEPSKDGFYVSTEPGIWYKKGEGIVEPSPKSSTIKRVESLLDGLHQLLDSAS